MDKLNTLLDITIGGGLVISLVDLQTYLGIGILAIQLILIIVKTIMSIVKHVKNRNYEKVEEVINKTIEEVDVLKSKVADNKED